MVFTNLQHEEKEAFFSLLDEYFTSRPEVLAHLAAQSSGSNASAMASKAASAVQRAVASKPDIASRFASSVSRQQATPSSTTNQAHDPDEDEPEQPVSVAARMAAFAAKNTSQPPPGRGPPPVAPKPSGPSGLVSSKTFGGIDTTSTKNALTSIYGNSKAAGKPVEPQAPPAPPAFPKRNNFAPPPTRSAAPPSPPPPPPRAPEPEPEEEEPQGEWAESLYDYSSNEPADLSVKEGDRILIVERTSDDWWTGECEGRRGLLPASYVKLL